MMLMLQQIPAHRWTTLAHRRLQAIPTQLTANNTLLASALPDWLLRPAVQRIEALGFFRGSPHGINHCLVNEYLPGQGIMPHEDGAAYHPVVATVSLGSTLVLDVYGRPRAAASVDRVEACDAESHGFVDSSRTVQSDQSWRIVQEPRSLLVTTGSAYTDTLHGIASIAEDEDLSAQTVANWSLLSDAGKIEACGGRSERSKRISLTFRDVKRVSSLSSRMFGRSRR